MNPPDDELPPPDDASAPPLLAADAATTPEPPSEIEVDVELVVTASTEAADLVPGGEPPPLSTLDAEVALEPSTSDAPQILLALATLGETLGRKLDALHNAFDRELRAESSREKVVDRLHAELQEYKHDLLLKVIRPIFIDLIQLHDDMGKRAEAIDDKQANALLRDYQQGIEDILYRQGVEPFTTDTDTFDPKRQRAVSTVPTDDPALNKTLAARLRKGFQAGEKIIRPELVSVYAVKT